MPLEYIINLKLHHIVYFILLSLFSLQQNLYHILIKNWVKRIISEHMVNCVNTYTLSYETNMAVIYFEADSRIDIKKSSEILQAEALYWT